MQLGIPLIFSGLSSLFCFFVFAHITSSRKFFKQLIFKETRKQETLFRIYFLKSSLRDFKFSSVQFDLLNKLEYQTKETVWNHLNSKEMCFHQVFWMLKRFWDVHWTLYCGSRDVDILEKEFSSMDEMKRGLKLFEVGKASGHITLVFITNTFHYLYKKMTKGVICNLVEVFY